MLSNVIGSKLERQLDVTEGNEEQLKAKLGAQFLNLFTSNIDANKKNYSSDSQKILESFEIKMTKSTVLSEVIEESKKIVAFNEDIREGELVCIENVKLSLENETELRTVKLFSNGVFKGFKVPGTGGLDVNNMFNSFLKDYAYKLRGDIDNSDNLLIKIPMTFENEFENSYCVDDLFIGKVTIVGIYKGKTKVDDLKNSFQFFQELGESQSDDDDEMPEINNSQYESRVKNIRFASSDDGAEYNYIDVLAIIQQIETEKEE
jgi:hypothetical protein